MSDGESMTRSITLEELEVDQIEDRVRRTICETWSTRGTTVEGRILKSDFERLLHYARIGAAIADRKTVQ